MKTGELERVRKELAKLLGIERYPDEPWETLLAHFPDVFTTANSPEMLLEEIEAYARLALDSHELGLRKGLARSQGPSRERSGEGKKVPPQLGRREEERSRVFSECLARLAVSNGVVRNSTDGPIHVYSGAKKFRVECLGDKVLSPQRARELLVSPVAADWNLIVFKKLGVPVVGHNFRVVENASDERGTYSLLEVILSGSKAHSIRDRRPIPSGPWEMPEDFETASSNRRQKREIRTPSGHWKILPFPGEDGFTHRVLVRPESVLGKLHSEVSRLIRRYPWDEAQATWFVLTGETPMVAPLTWQFRGTGSSHWNYASVTLKIEPWVPADLVHQVYSDVQRSLRGGHRVRPVEVSSLELLQFVNREVGLANLAELSLKERRRLAPKLVAAWDRENPNEAYGSNTWKFWRDLNRTRRAVVTAAYGPDDTESRPAKGDEQPKLAETSLYGPIYAGKWYILHSSPYDGDHTGYFDSREEALADPRSENSEVVTSEELVARRQNAGMG